MQLILSPAVVQGPEAPKSIVRAIQKLDAVHPDVMIVGRGGGSYDDLYCFNDEEVARAIFDAETPVISAVGHETDFTIADFVADLRAPTPSAAAELAVFDYALFEKDLADYRYSLKLYAGNILDLLKKDVQQYRLKMETLSPQNQLLQKKQYLSDQISRLEDRMEKELQRRKEYLAVRSAHLNGLSPLKRLSEGYSFVTDPSGTALKSIHQVTKNDMVRIQVTDGSVDASVLTVREEQYE